MIGTIKTFNYSLDQKYKAVLCVLSEEWSHHIHLRFDDFLQHSDIEQLLTEYMYLYCAIWSKAR